jgi:hypothetical protein
MTRPPTSPPIGIAFLGNNNSQRETLAKEVKKEYYTMPMPKSKMPMQLPRENKLAITG